MRRTVQFVILGVAVSGAAFIAYPFGRSPSASGESPAIATNPETAAAPVARIGRTKVKPANFETLSAAEKARILDDLAEYKRVSDALYDRASLFESELTSADIAKITAANPDSFFRRVGVFSSQSTFRGKCTRADFDRLVQTVGLEMLDERGSALIFLVQHYDERYLSDYYRKIRASWSTDARWREFRDLDAYYADLEEMNEKTKRTEADLDARVAKYEKVLVDSGVPASEVKEYVLRTAADHRNCLGSMSLEWMKWLRLDLTRARGNFLLSRLKAYWDTNHRPPAKLKALVPKGAPSHMIEDGWYNAFRVEEDDASAIVLYSDGPDSDPRTDDDIRIGEVSK